MTPSGRERRIAAVAREVAAVWPSAVRDADSLIVLLAERFLDAADEAVPVVSAKVHALVLGECQKERDAVEAVARDFVQALRRICQLAEGPPDPTTEWWVASNALTCRPSFLEEKGSEE